MRKSTRPASGISEPSSCTPMTRHLGGGGCSNSNGSTLLGTISRGCCYATDDDPK